MRLLFLSASATLGGAEISLLELMAGLRHAQPEWTLGLIAGQEGPLLDAAEKLNVRACTVPFPSAFAELGDSVLKTRRSPLRSLNWAARLMLLLPKLLRYRSELKASIDRFQPDVLHANGFKMQILATRVLPPEAGLIWHIHDYVSTRPVMKFLLRAAAPACTTAVANSNSVAEDARRATRGRIPVTRIYNGIDTAALSPEGPQLDLAGLSGLPPCAPGTLNIGLVATFARWKGHETFLRAVAALPPELPFRAYVVGGPMYRTAGSQYSLEELRTLAQQLGIGGRVGFTGFCGDRAGAFRALDIVVHASTEPEPFGMVIAEAMSCGRAVIASGAGGAAELVNPGINALTHAPGSVNELASRLRLLINDPDLRLRIADRARLDALQQWDRARLVSEFVPVYERAASGSLSAEPVGDSV